MDHLLTEQDKARLPEELKYSRSLEPDAGKGWAWDFLNSKFGSWLYGTVLASIVSVVWASAQAWLNRTENENALSRSRAQQDAALVVNVLPLIAKVNTPESALGIELVSYLAANNGIDRDLSRAFDGVLKKVAAEGFASANNESLTASERVSSQKVAEAAVSALKERAPLPVAPALPATEARVLLPPTVDIQIASEQQRSSASTAQQLLKQQRLVVPAIDNVGENSPNHTEVRYFNDSDQELAKRVLRELQVVEPAARVKRAAAHRDWGRSKSGLRVRGSRHACCRRVRDWFRRIRPICSEGRTSMLIKMFERFQLGPVLGLEDSSTVKVWVRAAQPLQSMQVRWSKAYGAPTFRHDNEQGSGFVPIPDMSQSAAAPLTQLVTANGYYTAQARLPGLQPDTRYFYEVVSEQEIAESPNAFVSRPMSFRTVPAEADKLSFAFVSCHDTDKTPLVKDPRAMWKRALKSVIEEESARLVLMGGDQVYADSVPADLRKLRRHEVPNADLDMAFGDAYLDQWRWSEVRLLMAHVPCLMMWDDHEIMNGWGSAGNEDQPKKKEIYEAAARAFDAHQSVHNPRPLGKEHRGFAITIGSYGFLVLDGRSLRGRRGSGGSRSAVLGDSQWADVRSWLDQNGGALTHLTVVTAVPLVFLRASTTSKLEFITDLVDQWSSPDNRADQLRLIGTLFEFRKKTGANILVLGGDVHAATAASIYSDDLRYRRPGEVQARFYELVASGISRKSAPLDLYGELREGDRLAERIGVDFETVHYSRNFAIVEALKEDRRFRCSLHLERQRTPIPFDWPGPA